MGVGFLDFLGRVVPLFFFELLHSISILGYYKSKPVFYSKKIVISEHDHYHSKTAFRRL